jgi:hypothetical protein
MTLTDWLYDLVAGVLFWLVEWLIGPLDWEP